MKKYQQSSWDLSEIRPKNIEQLFKEIDAKTQAIEKQRSQLTEKISVLHFLSLLKKIEEIHILNSKLGVYAQLWFAEDSSNQKASALLSQTENFLTKISNRLLFFGLWFKQLSDHSAERLIKSSGNYSYFLLKMRKSKPYVLKENEEKIINLKDISGVSALNSIYSILASQFQFDLEGKKVGQEKLLTLVRNPSPQKRKVAYLTLLKKYKEQKDIIGEIYRNIITDWREENVHLRGYETPISVRNLANDIPDQAIAALLRVCEKNESLFQDFFELKRKKIGLKEMRRFDLYAPLGNKKEKEIPYHDAVVTVLEVFKDFSSAFFLEATHIIDANHIHSNIQKNKDTGAFCCSVNAKLNPYVLLNYAGTLRDVSTLAHELGHGIHHNLARNQTEFTFHAPLPLAETASIFSEMVLSERLLEKYPERTKDLLFIKLDELYASIIRQAGFVRFEMKAHKMLEEGKTIDEMSAVYLQDLRRQLGPKVVVDDIFAYEWCYIPHIFHTPFYCYAYAFGNLLTLALYEKYKEEGSSFANKIVEMLAKGGSASPTEITRAVGVDITSEEFWQGGFEVIKKMLKRVE